MYYMQLIRSSSVYMQLYRLIELCSATYNHDLLRCVYSIRLVMIYDNSDVVLVDLFFFFFKQKTAYEI